MANNTWSLNVLLEGLHSDIEQKLSTARKAFGHPGSKGDASEEIWLEMLKTYLPKRYSVNKAFVVDSQGNFSDQIDIVISDRQYSPFIFHYQGQTVVPSESVYAVFEAKQSISAAQITYAQDKAESVRRLHRTSLPIPHAGGTYPPKPLGHILAGLLTFESDWSPALGTTLENSLSSDDPLRRLDLGCVAAHGTFCTAVDGSSCSLTQGGKPATAFLFELIARLQTLATVPMIDVRAYAAWLNA